VKKHFNVVLPYKLISLVKCNFHAESPAGVVTVSASCY
jgi:hypothetical protein